MDHAKIILNYAYIKHFSVMYYPDDKVALLDEYFTKLKCTQPPALALQTAAQPPGSAGGMF